MTFKEAAELYYELKDGLMKPSSHASSKHMYAMHIAPYFDEYDCEKINSRELQKFYNSLVNKKKRNNPNERLSEHTIKDIVGLVKTILYFAMEEGEIPETRFKTKKPYGMTKYDNGQEDFLNEKDYKKLIKLCTDGNFKNRGAAKIFIILSVTAGLRIGEVCGLQWGDIDFENKTISIKRTVQRIYLGDSGGEKRTKVIIGDPKSEKSKRTVYILDLALEALKQYKEYRNPKNTNLFVVGTNNGTVPNEPRMLRQAYARFLAKNDVKYIHPHALRHTFCTYAIGEGCDIKTVSELMGHSNVSMTLDIYTHTMEKQKEKTRNELNIIFSKEEEKRVI